MRYLLFTLAPVLMFCACGEKPAAEQSSNNTTKSVHAEPQKLEIQYPLDWMHSFNPDSNTPAALLTLQTPLDNQQDPYQENVQVYHEVLPMRISDSLYHRSAIGQIKINNPQMEVSDKGKHRYGDNEFNEWYFEFNKNNQSYCVHGYTCMRDSVGYNFSYTSIKEKETTYLKQVESILSSFKAL